MCWFAFSRLLAELSIGRFQGFQVKLKNAISLAQNFAVCAEVEIVNDLSVMRNVNYYIVDVFTAVNNVSLNDFVKTAISYALLHRNDLNRQMAR